jgi:hypothetical protein
LVIDEMRLLERLEQPGGCPKRRGVGTRVESAGVSVCCQGLQDGAAGTGRTEHDLCRFRRADRSALSFDSYPLDGFLDDLDAHRDSAVRGGAALFVCGASTLL